ncbi:TlpA disulfide reductase family protein [Sinomicrobium soli]|uniref:TlpA disulfide reductase family protein n=1 Tax=Sinomicrobium sp. N-1-3-6 TaxID=2219864 RepID=UPI000DCB44AB|nr:TlpA disulfide reductase family protein [Sinomicrobium sp. N-1-3-6]RAV28485.1 AhpC/TSA family protein [Sinomicrobium sp. N-1-3-6]
MKKYLYISLVFTLLSGACKDHKGTKTPDGGYTLTGTVKNLPPASLVILSYQQNDSTVADTAVIENGRFTFGGKVVHPSEAMLQLRHGSRFPEKMWESDTYRFFIENSTMQLTTEDSLKNAVLKGSVLTGEAIEIENRIRPLTDEIIALQNRMDGRSREEKLITYDTVQVYVDSIRNVTHRFIMSHPDSYVALQRFLRHELPKNFDPDEADKNFNTLFGETLRQTPTGKLIAEKIAIAKKSDIGKVAMDFTQETLEGEPFTLSSLRGKYVLVDFWASWCKPCRAENPFVVKAYEKYKEDNFEIVGVSLDAGKEAWKAAVEKDGLPWIHVSDLKYWKNEVAVQYDINSVPSSFLVDPEGVIIAKNLRGKALEDKLAEIFPDK